MRSVPSRSRLDAIRHISEPRLQRYLATTANDEDAALDLYEWNTSVSGAFFESISALEIALRNALHERLSMWCANDAGSWYDDPKGVFNEPTKRAIASARARVASKGARETPGRVVAEISFGFWRYLLTGAYQAPLWVPCLHHAFPGAKRVDIEMQVAALHELRNRIAHHEAIYHRDLERDYDYLVELAEHLHSRLGWWIDSRSRVPQVLRERPTA
jgi:hypothetical protein